MEKRVTLSILALVLATGTVNASAESLTILLHDYAEVGQSALQRAQTQAARILRSAGIETKWVNCPGSGERPPECHESPAATELVLHLLPAGTTRRDMQPGALGFAVPPEPGSFGSYGGVMYDRVERLRSPIVSTSVVLGHAIAHELGHLLLGPDRHAAAGIMKSEWHRKELTRAAQGTLVFEGDERREIQRNVRRRVAEVSNTLSISKRFKEELVSHRDRIGLR
jgi:hypothetical protein